MSSLFSSANAVEPWIENSVVASLRDEHARLEGVLGQVIGIEREEENGCYFLRVSDGKDWIWVTLSVQAERDFSGKNVKGCAVRLLNWKVSSKKLCMRQRELEQEESTLEEKGGDGPSQPETRPKPDHQSVTDTKQLKTLPIDRITGNDVLCLFVEGSIGILGGSGMGTIRNPGFVQETSTLVKKWLLHHQHDWNRIRAHLSGTKPPSQAIGDVSKVLKNPQLRKTILAQASETKKLLCRKLEKERTRTLHQAMPNSETTIPGATNQQHTNFVLPASVDASEMAQQTSKTTLQQVLPSQVDEDQSVDEEEEEDMDIENMLVSQPVENTQLVRLDVEGTEMEGIECNSPIEGMNQELETQQPQNPSPLETRPIVMVETTHFEELANESPVHVNTQPIAFEASDEAPSHGITQPVAMECADEVPAHVNTEPILLECVDDVPAHVYTQPIALEEADKREISTDFNQSAHDSPGVLSHNGDFEAAGRARADSTATPPQLDTQPISLEDANDREIADAYKLAKHTSPSVIRRSVRVREKGAAGLMPPQLDTQPISLEDANDRDIADAYRQAKHTSPSVIRTSVCVDESEAAPLTPPQLDTQPISFSLAHDRDITYGHKRAKNSFPNISPRRVAVCENRAAASMPILLRTQQIADDRATAEGYKRSKQRSSGIIRKRVPVGEKGAVALMNSPLPDESNERSNQRSSGIIQNIVPVGEKGAVALMNSPLPDESKEQVQVDDLSVDSLRESLRVEFATSLEIGPATHPQRVPKHVSVDVPPRRKKRKSPPRYATNQEWSWHNHPNSLIEKLMAQKDTALAMQVHPQPPTFLPNGNRAVLAGNVILDLAYAKSVE